MVKAPFLSTALTFMIVYVWARRNPQVLMNFLGIFNFTAPYMPWVLLGFSLLLSGQLPMADLIGIGAGHLYYYLMDVYPLLYGGDRPLKTPAILSYLLNPREQQYFALNNEHAVNDEEQRRADQSAELEETNEENGGVSSSEQAKNHGERNQGQSAHIDSSLSSTSELEQHVQRKDHDD